MNILEYLTQIKDETLALIEILCKIPSPSSHEDEKAEFCKNWLLAQGAKNVYIDDVKNVIYPVNCEDAKEIILFTAHTDTVFPDLDSLPFTKDDQYMYCPGVGDDTTCLAILLMIAKYVATHNLIPDNPSTGILFVANSCEEGLGNLKGIKEIFKHYGDRIKEAYCFDGQYNAVVNKCVGSTRYEVTIETLGGHSFRDFGTPNAIHLISELICRLYQCQVPVDGDSQTTYNVGIVEGGTSVNTIAQKATFLYEYRSDSYPCMEKMKAFFLSSLEDFQQTFPDGKIHVKEIGYRPCGNDVNQEKLMAMTNKVVSISEKYSGIPCYITSGSTDCNIPMSMGIPAVCPGLYLGSGEHTREEKVLVESIEVGLKIAGEIILDFFDC